MERCDCAQHGLEGSHPVAGQWGVEDMPGAPSGQRALVQRTTENAFNVIVAPSGPYTAMDISVRFKPMAGREDASGGLVFRFAEGQYSLVRANALENSFRLYAYEHGRSQWATARVQTPALGQWHVIRVVAVGVHIQASQWRTPPGASRRALWRRPGGLGTKADAITACDDRVTHGVPGT